MEIMYEIADDGIIRQQNKGFARRRIKRKLCYSILMFLFCFFYRFV